MRLSYCPDTDSLYIELSPKPGADSEEVRDGIVGDFEEDGNVVGLDIQHASETTDLSVLETDSLPLARTLLAVQ